MTIAINMVDPSEFGSDLGFFLSLGFVVTIIFVASGSSFVFSCFCGIFLMVFMIAVSWFVGPGYPP
tara:strand:+ start:723 stop:920 length:198 start_codon:yes stop_codon:yes gene_type:complete